MSYSATPMSARASASAVLRPPEGLPTEQMSPVLDALSLKFAIETRNSKLTALDVGCGDGLATAAALSRGGHVLAVDPDSERLKQLLARVPTEQYARLQVRVSTLQGLDFKGTHFTAVHAARVLHLLSPAELRQSLRKFFRWLYPEGKLFISTYSPAGRYWRSCSADAMTAIHLLDEAMLQRELSSAGFVVEDFSCYELQWDPDQSCCAVIARCGA